MRTLRRLLWSVGLLATGNGAARAEAPACVAELPADGSPLRRLTFTEFDSTVRDLLGDDSHPARHFPEEGGSGYDNNAHLQIATRLHAQKYMAAAEEMAARAAEKLDRLHACSAGARPTPEELACMRRFLQDFGRRAWRRPLSEGEVTRLQAGYREARGGQD